MFTKHSCYICICTVYQPFSFSAMTSPLPTWDFAWVNEKFSGPDPEVLVWFFKNGDCQNAELLLVVVVAAGGKITADAAGVVDVTCIVWVVTAGATKDIYFIISFTKSVNSSY